MGRLEELKSLGIDGLLPRSSDSETEMPVARDQANSIKTAWDEEYGHGSWDKLFNARDNPETELPISREQLNQMQSAWEEEHGKGSWGTLFNSNPNTEYLNSLLSSEHGLQSRNLFSVLAELGQVIGLREVASDQLDARDSVDDFIATLFPEHEMQARNFFSSLVSGLSSVTGIAEQFLPAILHFRDMSPEQFASLGKRFFDDLD